jgi:hypothetical protein
MRTALFIENHPLGVMFFLLIANILLLELLKDEKQIIFAAPDIPD